MPFGGKGWHVRIPSVFFVPSKVMLRHLFGRRRGGPLSGGRGAVNRLFRRCWVCCALGPCAKWICGGLPVYPAFLSCWVAKWIFLRMGSGGGDIQVSLFLQDVNVVSDPEAIKRSMVPGAKSMDQNSVPNNPKGLKTKKGFAIPKSLPQLLTHSNMQICFFSTPPSQRWDSQSPKVVQRSWASHWLYRQNKCKIQAESGPPKAMLFTESL